MIMDISQEVNNFEESEDFNFRTPAPLVLTYKMTPRLLTSLQESTHQQTMTPSIGSRKTVVISRIRGTDQTQIPSSSRGSIKNPNFPRRLFCDGTTQSSSISSGSKLRCIPFDLMETSPQKEAFLANGEVFQRNQTKKVFENRVGLIFCSDKLRNFMDYIEYRKLQDSIKSKESFSLATAATSFPILKRIELQYSTFKKIKSSSKPHPGAILKPILKKTSKFMQKNEKVTGHASVPSELSREIKPHVTFNVNSMVMIYDRDLNYFGLA